MTKAKKKKLRRVAKRRTVRKTRYTSKVSYRLKEIPIKQIQVWKEAQARKLDRAGISELSKSIRTEGLQNPPMVQKEGNRYLLMSGQRRLAALKRLGAKKIPVLVLTRKTEYDTPDAKAASVVENIHRKNMNVKEMADACAFLAEQMGKSKAAQSLGLSMSTFKKFHGFAGVPDKLKELVPKIISRDAATKLHQIIPDVSKAVKIANQISKLESQIKKRYLKVLERNPNSSHKKIMKKARSLALQQNVSLRLSKRKTRGLDVQSRRQDLHPNELANKIVSDWLSKRGY
ncbi:MAG TPA: ParB/RepB/Spo0J family partition protein [Nitrosopumilaceae archaeon]|nr:ParB/RepB/Spo0J family partition protein [Nitrosopumilaceae archaeon]